MESQTIKIAIYDDHSWDGPKEWAFDNGEKRFDFALKTIDDRPEDIDYALICDELGGTKFPFFFPRRKRIALLKETPRYYSHISPKYWQSVFACVYSHQHDLVQQVSNAKLLEYSSNWVRFDPDWQEESINVFSKSQDVSFIGSVLHPKVYEYGFRHKVAAYCIENSDIDCFGFGIKEIDFKTQALLDYRFSIAMENARSNYYFTEKIIDCFLTKTVPIYYGCSDIGRYFNLDGILQFSNMQELDELLVTLNEDRYKDMYWAVEDNYERCKALGFDSFQAYFARAAQVLADPSPAVTLGTNKLAAAIRFGLWNIQKFVA